MNTSRARQLLRIPASYSSARAAEVASAKRRHLVITAPLRYSVACTALIEAAEVVN